ncbi:MAG TPA: hypothetical protein PK264_21545 [Hyphomicrobiaceae bacterium]|nr:hypothetical protein [Hyphomicrobiaceae bacterium]
MAQRWANPAALTAIGLLLGACAQAAPGYEPPTARNAKRLAQPDPGPPGVVTPAGYVLSDSEKRYDCKKLTGIIQIKILQLREPASRPVPSAIAKTGPAIGGPLFGSKAPDPAEERATEIARLRAYNTALGEKKCRTFDIDAELTKAAAAPVPRTSAPIATPTKN